MAPAVVVHGTPLKDLPEHMQPHVEAACEGVQDKDSRIQFASIRGGLHPSSKEKGKNVVRVTCFKGLTGNDNEQERGSQSGSIHVYEDGTWSYYKDGKSAVGLAGAKSRMREEGEELATKGEEDETEVNTA